MATFTSPSSANAQSRTLINEIMTVYNECLEALGDSTESGPSQGDSIQSRTGTKIYTIQAWLEANVASFTSADTPQGAYDVSLWRTEAGIHSSGFRRVSGDSWPDDWTDDEDDAFSYGTAQQGDIIGPWLYDDLQKGLDAFSALVSVVYWTSTGITPYNENWGYSADPDLPTAIAAATSDFNGLTHASISCVPPSRFCNPQAYTRLRAYPTPYAYVFRRQSKPQTTVPSTVTFSYTKFYVMAHDIYGGNYNDQGDGFTDDEWFLHDSYASPSAGTLTGIVVGADYTTCPTSWESTRDETGYRGWIADCIGAHVFDHSYTQS